MTKSTIVMFVCLKKNVIIRIYGCENIYTYQIKYYQWLMDCMNLKCLFGFHRWIKLGGPRNTGGGKFEQRYKCTRCYKVKIVRE